MACTKLSFDATGGITWAEIRLKPPDRNMITAMIPYKKKGREWVGFVT